MGVAPMSYDMEEGTLEIGMEYRTVSGGAGLLVIPDKVEGPKYQEIVNICLGDGTTRFGQVLEVEGEKVIVQVSEGTFGIDNIYTTVQFTGDVLKIPISLDMLGCIFNGSRKLIHNGPPILPRYFWFLICRQAGLAKRLKKADGIIKNDEEDNFARVSAAVGVNMETAQFFKRDFEENGQGRE